jgi:ProP effector
MSSKRKRAEVTAALSFLVDAFPKAFTANPKLRQPLKIGIADDLIVRIDGAIQPRHLRLALTLYCGSVSYLWNCKIGAERVGLDGDVTGVVTAAEAEHAIDRLKAGAKAKKAALATRPQPPPAEAPPRKLSLSDLRIAAQMRKDAAS